jgi:carboxymethylenebutenolidase
MVQTTTYPGAQTSMITFGDRVKAFLAVPEQGTGPFPAMILSHERYGLVQHTLDLAAKFARYGYVGIAPDLFSHWEGDQEALIRGDVRVTISDYEIKTFLSAGFDFLAEDPRVDASKISSMGVCQSGEYPIVLNSLRPNLAANIVVYGGAQAGLWDVGELRLEPYIDIIKRITAPVLGIWGESDHVVSTEAVRNLRNALESEMKTYEFKLFRDMPHGWFNDTMPGRYRPKETAEAWDLIMDFLDRVHNGAFTKDRVTWKFDSDIAADYDFTKAVRLE